MDTPAGANAPWNDVVFAIRIEPGNRESWRLRRGQPTATHAAFRPYRRDEGDLAAVVEPKHAELLAGVGTYAAMRRAQMKGEQGRKA